MSKATVPTWAILSNESPLRTRTPRFAKFPIAATTAVGVANMNAHGQNTIMTVTVR